MNVSIKLLKASLAVSCVFSLSACSLKQSTNNDDVSGIAAENADSDESSAKEESPVNKNSYAYEVSQDPNYKTYYDLAGEQYKYRVYGDGTAEGDLGNVYPYCPRVYKGNIGKTDYDLDTTNMTGDKLDYVSNATWDDSAGRDKYYISQEISLYIKYLTGPLKVILTNADTGEKTLVLGIEPDVEVKASNLGERNDDYIPTIVPETGYYYIDYYVGPNSLNEHSEIEILSIDA